MTFMLYSRLMLFFFHALKRKTNNDNLYIFALLQEKKHQYLKVNIYIT